MNGSPSCAAWMPRHITWKLIGSNCLLWNLLIAEQKDDVFLASLSFVWFFKALKVGKSKILWKSWHDPAISSPFNQPIKILQSSLESIFILQLVICLVLKDLSRKRLFLLEVDMRRDWFCPGFCQKVIGFQQNGRQLFPVLGQQHTWGGLGIHCNVRMTGQFSCEFCEAGHGDGGIGEVSWDSLLNVASEVAVGSRKGGGGGEGGKASVLPQRLVLNSLS